MTAANRHRQACRQGRRQQQANRQQTCLQADDDADPGEEVAGTLLAATLARLGEISGRVFSEQLLDGVFRRFCVGK